MRRGSKICWREQVDAHGGPKRGRTWLGRFLAVFVGLIIGAVLAQEFWPEIEAQFAAHPVSPGRPAFQAPRQPGRALPAPVLPGQRPADPKLTSLGTHDFGSKVPLRLILVSTTPGVRPRSGTAAIGTNSLNPQTYMAGAILLNGARLSEIHRKYVILERNGKSARLYIQGIRQISAPEADSLLAVGGTQAVAAKAEASPDSGQLEAAQVTDYIRPNPVFRAGQLEGFILYPGGKPGAFARMGLASGDVVTEVNGVPVANIGDFMAMLQGIAEGNTLQVTVSRSGREMQLTLDGAAMSDTQGSLAATGPVQ